MVIIKQFFSLILISTIVNGEAPPEASPDPPAEDSSIWGKLFGSDSPSESPSPPPPPAESTETPPPADDAKKEGEETDSSVTDTVKDYATSALEKTGDVIEDAAGNALKKGAAMISEPGSQVDPNENLLEQTASYINLPPGVDADPSTIFGLYDALSKLVSTTPEGGVTLNMPTSEMLEKIKPWIDPYCDISPLIMALKGYEAYCKAKDTVKDVGNKVQDTANSVKDGAADAVNKVKDIFGR